MPSIDQFWKKKDKVKEITNIPIHLHSGTNYMEIRFGFLSKLRVLGGRPSRLYARCARYDPLASLVRAALRAGLDGRGSGFRRRNQVDDPFQVWESMDDLHFSMSARRISYFKIQLRRLVFSEPRLKRPAFLHKHCRFTTGRRLSIRKLDLLLHPPTSKNLAARDKVWL